MARTKTENFEKDIAVAGLDKGVTDNAFERETTVTYSDGEPVAYITTSRRGDITKLLKNPSFIVTSDEPAKNGSPRILMGQLATFDLITYRNGKRTGVKRDTSHLRKGPKCGKEKPDGTLCQMTPLKDSDHCRWHQS